MSRVTFPPEKRKELKYFSKEIKMLEIAGLSFSGNESTGYRIYSFLLIFCLNFMYPILQCTELFKQDFEVVSDISTYLISALLALARTLVMLQNRIQFGKMLDRLEKEPFTVNLERGGIEEEKINKECLWITNTQSLVYSTCVWLTVFADIIHSIIKRITSTNFENWELPFGLLTIVNITHSPNFEITWFYQNISVTFIVAHYIAIDLLMISVLAHISYQFKMLQNNIKIMVRNCYREMVKNNASLIQPSSMEDYEMDSSTIPWKYLHKHLKKVVEYHVEIINLASDMELVFSKLLLIIFISTLGVLSFSIYRISVVQDNMKVLISIMLAFSECLQVLVVCYWGDQVVFESQQVGKAAYEANFVGTNLKFQKNLAMVIRRSQYPTKLTAGKFADVCFTTFAWIIRTSYSAFMVVRNTSIEKTQVSRSS